jgi:rhodanese-related sulfurtransferase/uncharacterized membrane protein YedE/YeeE
MNLAAFIIVGVTCGILFAKYQVCFAAAVRNLIAFRKIEKMTIFIVLILASAILFNFLIGVGLLKETVKALMPMTFLGGILFGLGMIFAGGCAAGTLYRVGEGNVPSLIATIGMVIGMAVFGFVVASHFTTQLPHFVGDTTLISLNINPIAFSAVVAVLSLLILAAVMADGLKKRKKLVFVLTIVFVLALNTAILNSLFYFSYSNCQEMSPILLKEIMGRGEEVFILDIRPERFFEKGHIEGAVSRDSLPNGFADLNPYKDKMVVVVCGEGIISELFCIKLNKKGFKKIYNLKGGMSTWN